MGCVMSTAIAFLLVFRTDNAYRRLEEARECWAQVVHLCREIVTKSVVSMDYAVVCDMARYLCTSMVKKWPSWWRHARPDSPIPPRCV